LHRALLKNIPSSKIITNKKAIDCSQTEAGVTIYFEDGSSANGSAAIIADGIHSAIRKKYLPDSVPRYSGYTCWRGVVHNKWNLTRHAVEVWGAQGRFGYVPVGNNLVYWFACKNAPFKDAAMSKLLSNELAANFTSYAQPIPDIIASTPDKDLIWSDIIDLKPINRFAFDRVLLIGDAGHATTPNLGQGACQAMEDALCVSEMLESNSDDLVAAFRAFEKERIPRTHYIVNTSYWLGKLAQLENRFLIGIRNAVFRLTPSRVNQKQMEKVLDI
jgi:2-polyprenyl-6-methoxyphenol hydroxylase-like FAD-dependent oxidoreductase